MKTRVYLIALLFSMSIGAFSQPADIKGANQQEVDLSSWKSAREILKSRYDVHKEDIKDFNQQEGDFSWRSIRSISQSRFGDLNLYKADMRKSNISGLDAQSGKIAGTNFNGSVIEHARFTKISSNIALLLAKGADFRNTRLDDVEFIECNLDDTNFSGSKLNNVRFTRCILYGAKFNDCSMQKVNFSDCIFFSVEFRKLRGGPLTMSGNYATAITCSEWNIPENELGFSNNTFIHNPSSIKEEKVLKHIGPYMGWGWENDLRSKEERTSILEAVPFSGNVKYTYEACFGGI